MFQPSWIANLRWLGWLLEVLWCRFLLESESLSKRTFDSRSGSRRNFYTFFAALSPIYFWIRTEITSRNVLPLLLLYFMVFCVCFWFLVYAPDFLYVYAWANSPYELSIARQFSHGHIFFCYRRPVFGGKVARWQYLIPSFPWIAPGRMAWGRNPRKGRDQILQPSVAEP